MTTPTQSARPFNDTLAAFFNDYANAFSRSDAAAIARLWRFPAFITAEGRSAAFEDVDAFTRNTDALCAFYRDRGVAKAEKSVAGVDALYDGLFLVKTNDALFDADGGRIVAWTHAYLVRDHGAGELGVIAAIADGELAAWRSIGAPLG